MRQHYAHVDLSNGRIVAVNSKPAAPAGRVAIELEHALALRFIGGQENPNDWLAGLQDDKYVLRQVERKQHQRVDLLPISEVQITQLPVDQQLFIPAGVVVLVDRVSNELEVYYDGDFIKTLKQPLKIYATREGDPSYLKCALSLDVNILDAILLQNNLESWPNPLRVRLEDGTQDLSLFAPTASTTLAFEKPNA